MSWAQSSQKTELRDAPESTPSSRFHPYDSFNDVVGISPPETVEETSTPRLVRIKPDSPKEVIEISPPQKAEETEPPKPQQASNQQPGVKQPGPKVIKPERIADQVVLFETEKSDINKDEATALIKFINLIDTDDISRVQLFSYVADKDQIANKAKQLALERALKIKDIIKNSEAKQVNVEIYPIGNQDKNSSQQDDRVEIFLLN